MLENVRPLETLPPPSETTNDGTSKKPDRSLDGSEFELYGRWHGVTSLIYGSRDQTMEFFDDDDSSMQISLIGKTISGKFRFDKTVTPHHLDMQFFPPQSVPQGTPPPAIKCIAKIDGNILHLCSPDPGTERPSEFSGPGYIEMHRITEPPYDMQS